MQVRQVSNINTHLNLAGEIKSKSKSKDETVLLKVKVLRMLSDELIESERWIFSALHLLKETVRSSAANSLDRVSVDCCLLKLFIYITYLIRACPFKCLAAF